MIEPSSEPVLRLAHEEAKRGLDQQQATVENLRGRITSLLVASGVVLGLLVPKQLAHATTADCVAVGLFLVLAISCVYALTPKDWVFATDVNDILARSIACERSAADEMYTLAFYMRGHYFRNKKVLDRLTVIYQIACLLMAAVVVSAAA